MFTPEQAERLVLAFERIAGSLSSIATVILNRDLTVDVNLGMPETYFPIRVEQAAKKSVQPK